MIEVLETEVFVRWMANLRDPVAKTRIAGRLRQLAFGLLGDVKPLGDGISELRVHVGPGYRVYIAQRGAILIVVLCAGDKGSQARDLAKARTLARDLRREGARP